MIFITDELGKFEKNIIELAENMGFKECKTIEAIDLFCGISEKNDVLKEKDRYYAFIDIPQYWSVRADGLNGAIYDNKTKKANIYFKNPIEKRMVSRVEWIDRNNTVYRIDYYNKYGYMYCSENVSGGNVTVREFYDRNGDIKVLEQTGPKTYTTFGTRISPKSYRGFADYLEAYLKYNKIYDENIWLTSDEILNKFAWDYGNFKISYLPQNRLNSDLTVITQTNTAFRILCSEEQQVNWYKENSNYKCDRVYSYFENNELKFGKKEALTITESDQLEYIEQLINDFPEITFHIAASTIMSDKLTRLDINNNVELYPCITEQKRKELFERCDIYLDINHYRELYNAVNEAMVNNMIILAFDNTAHSKELYPMGNIFESSNYVKMKETLKNIITKIHVLYVGNDDWTTKYSIPDNIEFEVYESDESEPSTNRPARKLMDLVILDRDITLSEEKKFTKFTRGYCLFATENVQMLNSATSRYFKARMGQYLYTGDVQYFLAHEVRNYYPNPYGEKFNPAKLAVSDSFTGRVACDGNYNLVLDGEFGEDFSQIAYWRYNIPVFEGQCIDMYLEYEKTGDVEIKLRLFQFYYGSIGDIKQVWEFDEEQLQDVFRIDNESDQGPVFVSILARGTGSLNIISLHDRHSRRGHGFFLPGGERLVSSKGEEVFVYFEKGDMKPPLAVYFSGYRTQEGFEGYYMMRGFGCPFILVTDPRSEGGAFYLGDSEFEQMITDYVTDKLDELGLTKDELVLSGASMGTFGSLYYGSKLSPHALLLAKPLANMGNVARNERILRAGGFATSLDILMKNYDNLSDEAIEQLNNRMWDRFDSADWSQTKFIISYLYEDDYDPDGYPSILSHLKSSGVEVYGKGSHGRHTDNSSNVMAWFKSQYNNLLHDDFSR